MNDSVTKNQTRELAIRTLELISTILNSLAIDYDSALKTVRTGNNGVEFLNGAGNVVYTIPIMKEIADE